MAPFRSRNTGFNVSSPPPPLPPPSFPLPGIDPIPIPIPRKYEERASTREPIRNFAASTTFVVDGQVAASKEKREVIREEGRGREGLVFRREMRCLFRTEIGTTRSLRRSQTLECRYDEERTRHSSRIRPSRRGRKPRIGQKSEG